MDPLLVHGSGLRSALPIRLPELWQMYLDARDAFWLPKDIDLSMDREQWADSLGDGEKRAVSRILAFFATADGLVADNIAGRLSQEVAYTEVKFFYGFQIVMENIHAEMYARLIDAYLPDEEDQKSLLRWSMEIPSLAFKNIWAVKWIVDNSRSFAERLVAYMCVESVFFSASFASISWLKAQGSLPGLTRSNDLVMRDERLHIDFACALLRRLSSRPLAGVVRSIVREAVDIESEFVLADLLADQALGLDQDGMLQYVRYNADRLQEKMGYDKTYGVPNPVSVSLQF
ncbi:ribonucleotide reductase subunit M2 [Ephemerocybe angulata]|uniref:Ribonucleotide reductase subunit M2 n=1 Tax=Ephemerocybe angulata TaxID=980116 RepID=A0A8H6HJD5_9AGAR|nr:ribonucleotide reductase subunit M2 [Tulosesus angulatus]